MDQLSPRETSPRETSWTNHLREARLSGSTPGLHRTPSAPAAVVETGEYDPEAPDLEPEEYDPEVPQLDRVGSSHEEYDPADPGLQQTFSGRRASEEYDPEKPVAVRAFAFSFSLFSSSASHRPPPLADPCAAWRCSQLHEEYDPSEGVEPAASAGHYAGAAAAAAEDGGSGTPPGPDSPRSPADSDGDDSDGERERGRGRENERGGGREELGSPRARLPPGVQQGAGNNSGVPSTETVVRHAIMALQALTGTVRLSEESWYLWGELGAARLASAQQLARGLLSTDVQSLLRDTNVAHQLRELLSREHEQEQRAEQQAETPRLSAGQRHSHRAPFPFDAVVGARRGPQGARHVPGPDYVCNICGVAGHWISDCPRKQRADGAGGGSNQNGIPGNTGPGLLGARPKTTRPGHSAPPEGYTCNACGIKGHWIQRCPERIARRENRSGEQRDRSSDKDAAAGHTSSAPYEDWMAPAGVTKTGSAEGAGKRKRPMETPSGGGQWKRPGAMAPPPSPREAAAKAKEAKEAKLVKMKGLMAAAEAAETAGEKRELLKQLKALQAGK